MVNFPIKASAMMRALWSSCFPEEKDSEFIQKHFLISWLVQIKYYKGNFVVGFIR